MFLNVHLSTKICLILKFGIIKRKTLDTQEKQKKEKNLAGLKKTLNANDKKSN